MAKSKSQKDKANALKITTDVYNEVAERDNGCILCQTEMHQKFIEAMNKQQSVVYECHHYITRARSGMGIAKNLVILCKFHHLEETKYREEIKNYLKTQYNDWNEEDLIWKK